MTASKYLHIIAIGLVVVGWGARVKAEDDVTILPPPSTPASEVSDTALAPDGTPVVHKSFHKKRDNSTGTASATTTSGSWVFGAHSAQTDATSLNRSSSLGPAVETGLPIARHSMGGSTTVNVAAPIPTSATLPSASYSNPVIFQHKSPLPPIFPGSSSTTVASYTPPTSTSFADRRESKNTYPWKTDIITTMFYIGEGGTPISSTTNVASAWDEDWRTSNGGTDSPNNRVGYTPALHAARVNPFYVALPFNDLAFPDKARRWLPKGWYRPSKNGKQVSACQHRWVEIKTEDGSGRTCYAQWEDVGPLRYDHAEYVFGSERPNTYTRAGLDVSPAVVQYLHLDMDKKAKTRWRFVDDVDVPPGDWLKFDEEAVLYRAFQDMKKPGWSSPPIQKAAAPIETPDDIDSYKRKVGTAKG